jgi:tetratricopeptide (TPR) repeat protein
VNYQIGAAPGLPSISRMPPSRFLLILLVVGMVASPSAAQLRAPNEAVRQGTEALNNGDVDRAAAIFGDALRRDPGDPQLLLGAGVVAALQGRDSDAIPLLKRSLKIEPRLAPAAALLGELLYRQGDLDEAIKLYDDALSGMPPDVAAAMRRRLQQWRQEAALPQNHTAVKDDRFTVKFDGPVQEMLATRAIRILGAAFWNIGKTFGAYPSASINVTLYTTQQFHDITGAPEWAGGGFDGQIRIPVAGAVQNLAEFDRILTHELVHAMLKQLAATSNVPAWLNEGLAMHFDGHDTVQSERRLAAMRLFVPLSALRTGFARLNDAQAALAYEESAFATRVLLDRIGDSAVPILLQDLGTGQSVEEAVGRFGFTFETFQTDLARRLGAPLPHSPELGD